MCYRDSNQQRIVSGESMLLVRAGTKSLLSQQHQIRMDRRSMRGSRPSSLKVNKMSMKENGDIHMHSASLTGRRTDDFDIKVWQQKKQQAEIKR